MSKSFDVQHSTGLRGLDNILKGIITGDNIVWQINSIDEYKCFVEPYAQFAHKSGKELIYFRFARHEPLLTEDQHTRIYKLDPDIGFETFLNEIHQVIKQTGRGAYYVFDCLSELVEDWYSDQMLGNFFMLTCPYLYDMETIAYFGLYRNYHSFHATTAILDTTQVFIDTYRQGDKTYVQPIKVQYRYSSTMYMLHVRQGEDFTPIMESATISEVLSNVDGIQLTSTTYEPGIWNRTFLEAEETLKAVKSGNLSEKEVSEAHDHLIKMFVSRDERVSQLVKKYSSLENVVKIGKRVIGTGLIGGKTVGMLLARAILEKADPHFSEILESHDSFYIGSDVFYTFLVKNGIWWERQRQKDTESFLEGSARARQRMIVGTFPDYIEKQLNDLLDYFGQSPFIVRSSSLLEDNFGNAFAGKYESVFCVNQGPRDKRLEDLKTAVKTIYASAMSEKALNYRAQRGLLDHDEQMALLVQRVSGAFYGKFFLPQSAGVGYSFNPYVWSDAIDPQAGVLRLVFGLGTRAVDRTDDDYTRIVALNAPNRHPESSGELARQYTQKKVDVLDLEANQLAHYDFTQVAAGGPALPLDIFATRDPELEKIARQKNDSNIFPWILDFRQLLKDTCFIKDMRDILQTLHHAYDYPVDIEFTCNFFHDSKYKINLVQCRPFQVKGGGDIPDPPENIPTSDLILKSQGSIIGHSRDCDVDRFIYVVPSVYAELPLRDRYAVARLIGKLIRHSEPPQEDCSIMLIGPGRWGTTSPELGVPISFSEIDKVSIICEVVRMRDDLVPDVSLGTHLFNDLVEMDILYMALFPEKEENYLNEDYFLGAHNRLAELLPEEASWSNAVMVIDSPQNNKPTVKLNANVLTQKAVCFLHPFGGN